MLATIFCVNVHCGYLRSANLQDSWLLHVCRWIYLSNGQITVHYPIRGWSSNFRFQILCSQILTACRNAFPYGLLALERLPRARRPIRRLPTRAHVWRLRSVPTYFEWLFGMPNIQKTQIYSNKLTWWYLIHFMALSKWVSKIWTLLSGKSHQVLATTGRPWEPKSKRAGIIQVDYSV